LTSTSPAGQSDSAKKAEIDFRPFLGEGALTDPISGRMFRERAYLALIDFNELAGSGIGLSPFLEIGAGSGQRSAALMNHFGAEGVATDISQGALQNEPFARVILGYEDGPWRICCDAHHLPFLANTFQFVFAYRTLHHFSNPVPAVAECHRVLGKGGHFFFNDEPMIGPIMRLTRGRRQLSDPPSRWQRWAYRYRLEKVFWDDGARERSLGIVEARYDLDLWRQTLAPFETIQVEVSRRLKLRSNLDEPAFTILLTRLMGGNVKGLCTKGDGETVSGDFRERLMCLDCGSGGVSQRSDNAFGCPRCGREYPLQGGLIRMLPQGLEGSLYPSNS
jgi:SAM-dependent methyltransferase